MTSEDCGGCEISGGERLGHDRAAPPLRNEFKAMGE